MGNDMAGSIHIMGPQEPHNNLPRALKLFCPKGDVAVISAGWRYDECELQNLQRDLGRKIRHIPLYEWFDNLGSVEPELSGLHRIRQRRILAYKRVYQTHLDAAIDSWNKIQVLYKKNPAVYEYDEEAACRKVRAVDQECIDRLAHSRRVLRPFQPWMHESAMPLLEQIAHLERCSALIITGSRGHFRMPFFGLEMH